MARPPTKLVEKWEKILQSEGLGVLGGHDEQFSTFPRTGSVGIFPLLPGDEDKQETVADLPQAQLWRRLSRAANDLPRNRKHRKFLIDFADSGNVEDARKRYGLSRQVARGVVDKFFASNEVDRDQVFARAMALPTDDWPREPPRRRGKTRPLTPEERAWLKETDDKLTQLMKAEHEDPT